MDTSENRDSISPEGWILGIDISIPGGGVSLFSPFRNICRKIDLPDHIRTSRVLLPAVCGLLDEAGVDRRCIMAVGTALGPGSFTGLRISLATAKGLTFGLKCPLYGIPSLEGLADTAWRRSQVENLASPFWILAYRDARHGELFSALFGPYPLRGGEKSAPPRSGITRVGSPDEVEMPESGTVLLAGSKDDLPLKWVTDSLGPRFLKLDIPSSPEGVARLTWEALRRGAPPAPPDVQPIYGRRPRAETQWDPPSS